MYGEVFGHYMEQASDVKELPPYEQIFLYEDIYETNKDASVYNP